MTPPRAIPAPGERATVTTLAVVTLALALLALATPLGDAEFPATRVGGLLAIAAVLEALHGVRRSTAVARRRAMASAAITFAVAVFLINAPFVAAGALRTLLAGWFAIDAIRHLGVVWHASTRDERLSGILGAMGNTFLVLLLLLARGWLAAWVIAVTGALRIVGVAWNIMTADVHGTGDVDETVVGELGLPDDPAVTALASEVDAAAQARGPADRAWTVAFVATLFAIHIGRMSTDLTLLGLVSPAVAVAGDMAIAVLATWLVITPLYLSWRLPTRWLERRVWMRYLGRRDAGTIDWTDGLLSAWLRWRLSLAFRLRRARLSVPVAIQLGLRTGLPIAAVIAATVPVWGMSWYFDTENWASGIWNSWAESRTNEWREAMVRAVLAGKDPAAPDARLAVEPEGLASGDFSFVVIGDPGEGDASQHVLRDQLLSVAGGPDVRFVVVSSDVVYPTGAMKDYEAKFWLPFKGVTRPVYAIPGNHDWYDALEGFAATFLEPDAARTSIRARVEADLRLTSTTDDRIEGLIGTADRLRRIYGVPTGFQRAPFFELQTDRFALVAIDTGVLRQIDPVQEAWLEGALDRAAGKTTMAIVGHPFYAGGHEVTDGDEEFSRLERLLLDHGVTIVMGGDTHDLEYYAEARPGAPAVHHFVNGGGGAYLSFGTALSWPATAPTAEWAYYPTREAVTFKIDTHTPWWKRPAWWWTRTLDAWPFSAEWLSAVFDYNVAPFFQSFVEVRVERSRERVRIVPYGVNGRLRWDEIASSGLRRTTEEGGPFVEWVVPMAAGVVR
jgi:hypothetical protein